MAWIALFLAGLLEIVWAAAMKQSDGFTRFWPSVTTIVAMGLSFALLAWSMRSLPLGTAYPIWTGIGVLGAFLIGAIHFGEALTVPRVAAALLILCGLVMLKLSTPAEASAERRNTEAYAAAAIGASVTPRLEHIADYKRRGLTIRMRCQQCGYATTTDPKSLMKACKDRGWPTHLAYVERRLRCENCGKRDVRCEPGLAE